MLIWFLATGLQAQSIQYDQPGPHPVKVLDFPSLRDDARHRKVPMKVHFPTDAGPVPLIVFSHGGAGNRDANYAQAHHLASHGYVVICPEHIMSNTDRVRLLMSPEGGGLKLLPALKKITRDPQANLQRPRDVSFAIDTAAAWNRTHPDLKGKIDTGKVAVMGHSHGGYTTLVACGARPTLDYLQPSVGKGLGPDLSDDRITFGITLSPQGPGEPFFTQDSYQSLDRPLIGITGSRDRQQGSGGRGRSAEVRKQGFELWPPGNKTLLWLNNADHMAFSDSSGSGRKIPWWLGSRAKEDTQRIVRAVSVLYCNYYLRDDATAVEHLNVDSINGLCGKVVDRVEWFER